MSDYHPSMKTPRGATGADPPSGRTRDHRVRHNQVVVADHVHVLRDLRSLLGAVYRQHNLEEQGQVDSCVKGQGV